MTAGRIRLMLIDDHPLVRDGVRARLETVTHFEIVGEAGDASGALVEVATHRPDLVLMDINLRGTQGIDLTRQLLALYPAMRVVMLTMHDQPQYVIESFRAGARGYVLKDSPAQEIVTAIETVMAGRRYYSAGVADALAEASTGSADLTQRERDILALIAEGLANKEIAARLSLSVRTVETHRLNIKRKLDLEGPSALIKFALERKWTAR
ncbi:MAG: response regulator transcription factor [Rhodocyclaceae bacterium]|jgi:two-component system, NarL family, nitrate/nitrite response regulator NarL